MCRFAAAAAPAAPEPDALPQWTDLNIFDLAAKDEASASPGATTGEAMEIAGEGPAPRLAPPAAPHACDAAAERRCRLADLDLYAFFQEDASAAAAQHAASSASGPSSQQQARPSDSGSGATSCGAQPQAQQSPAAAAPFASPLLSPAALLALQAQQQQAMQAAPGGVEQSLAMQRQLLHSIQMAGLQQQMAQQHWLQAPAISSSKHASKVRFQPADCCTRLCDFGVLPFR
jgi:hypothetical protein